MKGTNEDPITGPVKEGWANKICKCNKCGVKTKCREDFDFYQTTDGQFLCQACFDRYIADMVTEENSLNVWPAGSKSNVAPSLFKTRLKEVVEAYDFFCGRGQKVHFRLVENNKKIRFEIAGHKSPKFSIKSMEKKGTLGSHLEKFLVACHKAET